MVYPPERSVCMVKFQGNTATLELVLKDPECWHQRYVPPRLVHVMLSEDGTQGFTCAKEVFY